MNQTDETISEIAIELINSPLTPAGFTFGLIKKQSPENAESEIADVVIAGDLITPESEKNHQTLNPLELHKRICELETIICTRPKENILAIDKCGNVIMHNVGEKNRVSMNREYWDDAKIVTHNHPSGRTFSGADVSCLFSTNCDEIRACTFNTWYSIKRTEKTPNLDADKVELALSQTLTNRVIQAAKDACKNNYVTVQILEDKRELKPIKGIWDSEEEFRESLRQAKKEFSILSVVYTHKALKEYADANKILYEVGELTK